MNNKSINKIISIIIIIVAIILGYVVIKNTFSYKINIPTKNICPNDIKECSDGTIVRRIAPSCDFEACPVETEDIVVFTPEINSKIESPLIIKGKARGNWFFEAQFPVELYDANDNLLGKTIMHSLGEWTTNDYVDFEGTLDFSSSSTKTGVLKFLNDNPSGLPENQKIFIVPIRFE